MKIGSLFSGIGGLELGLEWAGVGYAVWQVEREPFCRSVLERHWPNAKRFDDVRTVGDHNLEYVDVICGGFPCQDISYAGKGLGLSGERSGLWYEFARVIGEMGPRFVVVENVAALVTRGLPDVLGTLSDLGYDAQWRDIRASDVGAKHKRERVFIVAHAESVLGKRTITSGDQRREPKTKAGNGSGTLADADNRGQSEQSGIVSQKRRRAANRGAGIAAVGAANVEPRMGRGAHGIPARVDRCPAGPGETQHAWEPPRTCEKAENRAARLRALGNAVVPQVAEEIGRWLLEIKDSLDK